MYNSIQARRRSLTLGFSTSRKHFPRMSTVICYRTKEEIDKEVAAIHRVGVENAKTKKKARAFLIKAGFITKDGKQLAEPYR